MARRTSIHTLHYTDWVIGSPPLKPVICCHHMIMWCFSQGKPLFSEIMAEYQPAADVYQYLLYSCLVTAIIFIISRVALLMMILTVSRLFGYRNFHINPPIIEHKSFSLPLVVCYIAGLSNQSTLSRVVCAQLVALSPWKICHPWCHPTALFSSFISVAFPPFYLPAGVLSAGCYVEAYVQPIALFLFRWCPTTYVAHVLA